MTANLSEGSDFRYILVANKQEHNMYKAYNTGILFNIFKHIKALLFGSTLSNLADDEIALHVGAPE